MPTFPHAGIGQDSKMTTMASPAASTSPRLGRILIVDDDDNLRELVSLTLRKAGHDCRTARGGVEGLSALCSEDFAVVLTDLEMPDLNGKELLAAMKEAGIEATTIVLTGHGDVNKAVEAMKLGAFDFLLKPVVTDELVYAIDRAIEYNRVRQHGRAMERLAAEWQTTFDACPDLIAVLDTEQRLIRCNDALAAQARENKDSIAGRFLEEFLEGGRSSEIAAACQATLAHDLVQTIEIRDTRLGGDLLVTTSPLRDERGQLFGLVFLARNITERKHSERALRRYADQLEVFQEIDRATLKENLPRDLVRTALAHICKLVPCERAFAILIDLEKGEGEVVAGSGTMPVGPAEGQKIALGDLLPMTNGDHFVFRRTDPVAAGKGRPLPPLLRNPEVQSAIAVPLHNDGTPIGQFIFLSENPAAFSKGVIEMARKVVAHMEVAFQHAGLFEQVRTGRERLQALSQRLVEVHEVERRQIARELHDEIGQQLTGLKLMLEMDGAGAGTHTETLRLVNDLMNRVRALSLDLRPSMLDDLGLLPTLVWFFDRYTSQTGVRVTFDHSGLEGRFPAALETAAYRIVQEALTNVARYAQVTRVTVRLWVCQDILTIQIQDQGAGFDAAAALKNASSNGLTGMRERAMLLGGTFTVESTLGQGTQVTAEFPLNTGPRS
jgi:PAS domain S-box-containing protein